MTTAVRINNLALTGRGERTLAKAEKHGKRLDSTSQRRIINSDSPLVTGSLDLMKEYKKHMQGVKVRSDVTKPVLHALVQWPVDMEVTEASQQWMHDKSIEFINSRFGGSAVFASRFDKDERGQHAVDVFFMPRYYKTTKKGKTLWGSTSTHLHDLCKKHSAEIMASNSSGKFVDNTAAQMSALQSEWREYLTHELGLVVPAKCYKVARDSDRMPPEVYGAKKDAAKLTKAAKAAVATANKALEAVRVQGDALIGENISKADKILRDAQEQAAALKLEAQADWAYVQAVCEANGIRPSDLIQPSDNTPEPPRS